VEFCVVIDRTPFGSKVDGKSVKMRPKKVTGPLNVAHPKPTMGPIDDGTNRRDDEAPELTAEVLTGRLAAVRKSPVNFSAVMSQTLSAHLPGVKLDGDWKPWQVEMLKGALQAFPKQAVARLHGLTFRLEGSDAHGHSEAQPVTVDQGERRLSVQQRTFELPKVNQVPLATREIVGGLAQLLFSDSNLKGDYARLFEQDSAPFSVLETLEAAMATPTFFSQTEPKNDGATVHQGINRTGPDPSNSAPALRQAPPRQSGSAHATRLAVPQISHGQPSSETNVAARQPTVSAQQPKPGTGMRNQGRAESRPVPGGDGREPVVVRQKPTAGVDARDRGVIPRPSGIDGFRQPGRVVAPAQAATGSPGVAATGALGANGARGSAPGHVSRGLDGAAVRRQGEWGSTPNGGSSRLGGGVAQEQLLGGQFAEGLKLLVFQPELLLKRDPAQFLLLNADLRHYTPADVMRMAEENGVKLERSITDLLLAGRGGHELVGRISAHHGLKANEGLLKARDQAELSKNASLERLTERLALDIGVRGTATRQTMAQARILSEQYHQTVAELKIERDPIKFGMSSPSGVFRWLGDRLRQAGWLPRSHAGVHFQALRAEFARLPLASQLRVDPRLALGAAWFRLSPYERSLLSSESGAQRLSAAALRQIDETGYIPQNLTRNEQHNLALRTLLDGLFDIGASGQALRAKLLQPQSGPGPLGGSVKQVLASLRARNGADVATLLEPEFLKSFDTAAGKEAVRIFFEAPEWRDALHAFQKNTVGAEALMVALLSHASDPNHVPRDAGEFFAGVVQTIKKAETSWRQSVDSPLELALTEINRQVQEGNDAFVLELMAPLARDGDLESLLGKWLVGALTPTERTLLKDPTYRRYLVEHARNRQTTGVSLASDARQFHDETGALQQSLGLLLAAEPEFRKAFASDARRALERAKTWSNLPNPIKLMLENGELQAQRTRLSEAVEEVLSSLRSREQASKRSLENLGRAVQGINAGNFGTLIETMDRPVPEVGRLVKARLSAYLSDDDGNLTHDDASVF
jgi:hypothetical protein